MNELDDIELIRSVEAGGWKSVDDFEGIKKALMTAASETALKDHRINVRISGKDVEALKTIAMEEGIPYQTLVTGVLHKYVTGKLRDSEER